MSGHDLYADDFPPHGTTAGYAAGCHSGGACPGKLERGQSCVQANQRYAADYGYRKAVDRGDELAALAEELMPAEPVKKREPKPVARRKPPAPTVPVEVVEVEEPEAEVEVVEPTPEEQPAPAVVSEQPRPRGHRVLQESLLTLTESIEMQRGVLVVMERALRTTRQEVIQLRKELEEQERS